MKEDTAAGEQGACAPANLPSEAAPGRQRLAAAPCSPQLERVAAEHVQAKQAPAGHADVCDHQDIDMEPCDIEISDQAAEHLPHPRQPSEQEVVAVVSAALEAPGQRLPCATLQGAVPAAQPAARLWRPAFGKRAPAALSAAVTTSPEPDVPDDIVDMDMPSHGANAADQADPASVAAGAQAADALAARQPVLARPSYAQRRQTGRAASSSQGSKPMLCLTKQATGSEEQAGAGNEAGHADKERK
jgi:hypothetical protein